jgi:hypothetical protein
MTRALPTFLPWCHAIKDCGKGEISHTYYFVHILTWSINGLVLEPTYLLEAGALIYFCSVAFIIFRIEYVSTLCAVT